MKAIIYTLALIIMWGLGAALSYEKPKDVEKTSLPKNVEDYLKTLYK